MKPSPRLRRVLAIHADHVAYRAFLARCVARELLAARRREEQMELLMSMSWDSVTARATPAG